MPRLSWSHASRRDLRAINTYLSERDPAAAVRILRAIRRKARQLEAFPNSAPQLDNGWRNLSVPNTPYVILFVPGDEQVEIVRIRRVREDWLP